MQTKDPITAKANTREEQSDSIVVSFGAEWHQPLLAQAFAVVIRKRVPKESSFRWLYFHINSPVGALCARAKIESIVRASKKEAVALSGEIHLSPAQIISYIGTDSDIGCYKLGSFQLSREPASVETLNTKLTYHAPQSFFILSKQAKQIVDHFLGFSTPKASKAAKAKA